MFLRTSSANQTKDPSPYSGAHAETQQNEKHSSTTPLPKDNVTKGDSPFPTTTTHTTPPDQSIPPMHKIIPFKDLTPDRGPKKKSDLWRGFDAQILLQGKKT
jgi:hypothetical protein